MANFARPGQPLRIPANDWNDLLRLRDVARKSGLLGAGGAFRFKTDDRLKGYRIYQADGTVMTISYKEALVGYEPDMSGDLPTDWSLEFAVTGSTLDDFADDGEDPPVMTNPIGTSSINDPDDPTQGREFLHDGDASNLDGSGDPDPIAQTYYRIPIIRNGRTISHGGVFRENIRCDGERGLTVELLQIA